MRKLSLYLFFTLSLISVTNAKSQDQLKRAGEIDCSLSQSFINTFGGGTKINVPVNLQRGRGPYKVTEFTISPPRFKFHGKVKVENKFGLYSALLIIHPKNIPDEVIKVYEGDLIGSKGLTLLDGDQIYNLACEFI